MNLVLSYVITSFLNCLREPKSQINFLYFFFPMWGSHLKTSERIHGTLSLQSTHAKNVVELRLNGTCGKSSLGFTASTDQTNIQHTSQLRSSHTSFQSQNKLLSANGTTAAEPPSSTISEPVNIEHSSPGALFGHSVSTKHILMIDFI